ncbi:MAG: glycosyltransferase family 2 protein, partial [Nanoarchaeota archaeon]
MNIVSYLPTIITLIFLLFVLSYYVLMFLKEKKIKNGKSFSSITVIIPAHNEEPYIAECVQSVLAADFRGKKEVIVVDDGSKDNTYGIAKAVPGITVIQTKHMGKSASLNLALKRAKGEVIAVVDGDSIIAKDSLVKITRVLSGRNVAAACCVVKVRNRKSLLGMWMHIEQIYNSLLRSIFAKVNANVTTPGPLSVYRANLLREIGGFSTKGF